MAAVKQDGDEESFLVRLPAGAVKEVRFVRAATLMAGDELELYFFAVGKEGEDVVVALSGCALQTWQRAHRYLTREEKMAIAARHLQQALEAGTALTPETLYVGKDEFEELVRAVGIVP
jgi:hypothetical protein